nr:retrovirus-related Pol polyprotein from transposon TNT 1-94 [Tanacetum cinerariifolium]
MIIKKDSKIVKAKVERKSLALKAKKNLLMKSVRLPEVKTKSTPWRCGEPNHLIGECLKPPKDKNQRAFVGGSWSDSGEEEDEKICLGVDLELDNWIKDSGCSKHMTGNRKLFTSYKAYNGGNVIFYSNLRGNIIGKEPKNVNEALADECWIVTMQQELNQFISNDVWELVPQPRNMTIIGTKWVFRNKLDRNGIVCRIKARLVAQSYNQQKGIDYDETYALVARLELIRILLAYACALDFKLFQMDVKSTFLNGFINQEVYMAQPSGFINFEKPNHVYKLKKALYGLKQALKAWRICEPKEHYRYLYVRGMLFDILVHEETNHSCISTTEAEYVSARKVCQQALRMKQALIDYDVRLDDVSIMCDNKDAIDLSKNLSLDELENSVPTDGPYQTNLPSPDDIISSIRIDREGQVRRIRHKEEIDVHENQILTREIVPTLKPLEEIIQKNIFCLGGNRDHVPTCLCYMLY